LSFEVRYGDLAGRIGKLETSHGILNTPAFIPVVHPVTQMITPSFLTRLGFEAVITNAYTTLKYYGDHARSRGIHGILNYDGIVMTDSGGYQILEYGTIEAEPHIISQFELDIGSDIAVPLDKPTGYKLEYGKAKQYVEETLTNAKNALKTGGRIFSKGEFKQVYNYSEDIVWAGPVQGAEHLDLVIYSARSLDQMGFPLLAIGSPVEVMEAYDFSTLAQMVATVRRTSPTKPIHLFGAGHPITIPLAISLGCDMFDSASYMLYAKNDRYMHSNGTAKLRDLSYLPCKCPVCCQYTVKELQGMKKLDRTQQLAKHNLFALKAEVDTVRQAIIDGRLWEYVMLKARAHPKLMASIELFKDFDYLEHGTPLFKDKAILLYGPIDQYRPEAIRFKRIVAKFRSAFNKKLVLFPTTELQPFYSTREYMDLAKKYPESQICSYNRFLGIIPVEICDIFPAAHHLDLATGNAQNAFDFPTFIHSLDKFLADNIFENITIIADDFMESVISNDRYKGMDNLEIQVLTKNRDLHF
jgi:7-cyano-7-deazaguanine tRNA-ribosyltransferase